LAGEIIGKLNSVDADVAGKFAAKMQESIKRNAAIREDLRKQEKAAASPTKQYEEMELRQAMRVATVTRRYDWLAAQGRERMFVRD
jgi:hypothetical protein